MIVSKHKVFVMKIANISEGHTITFCKNLVIISSVKVQYPFKYNKIHLITLWLSYYNMLFVQMATEIRPPTLRVCYLFIFYFKGVLKKNQKYPAQ